MDKGSIKKYAIGGISALLIGGALLNSTDDNSVEMTVALSQSDTASTIVIHTEYEASPSHTDPIIIETAEAAAYTSAKQTVPPETTTDKPRTQISEASSKPPAETTSTASATRRTTDRSPVEQDAALSTDHVEIASASTTQYTTASTQISATVYVSNAGKYHRRSNCSGMKQYTEMSLNDAKAAGHVACKKCYK